MCQYCYIKYSKCPHKHMTLYPRMCPWADERNELCNDIGDPELSLKNATILTSPSIGCPVCNGVKVDANPENNV